MATGQLPDSIQVAFSQYSCKFLDVFLFVGPRLLQFHMGREFINENIFLMAL